MVQRIEDPSFGDKFAIMEMPAPEFLTLLDRLRAIGVSQVDAQYYRQIGFVPRIVMNMTTAGVFQSMGLAQEVEQAAICREGSETEMRMAIRRSMDAHGP